MHNISVFLRVYFSKVCASVLTAGPWTLAALPPRPTPARKLTDNDLYRYTIHPNPQTLKPCTQPSTRWNVLRYLLAVHQLFYWQLRKRMFQWGKEKKVLICCGVSVCLSASLMFCIRLGAGGREEEEESV